VHLVQILLPVFDNEGIHQPRALFKQVSAELADRFGGLTAFTRAPAEGQWKDDSADTTHDEIVVFEVMAEELDRAWWKTYRRELEARFRQELIIIRAQVIEQI
jgi:hypothetical protein